MACGLPVVCTDGGALPEVVGDAATIVRVGDSEALDHAISGLLDNEPLREKYARIGRERILARFSWRQAAEEMTRLYRGVIAGYGE